MPASARSTRDPALQLDALAAAGCVKVFEDRACGARSDRPGLRQALDYVREGDVLVVWKLDRLGRSLAHLIETITTLAKGLTVRETASRLRIGKTALYEALRPGAHQITLAEAGASSVI